MMMMTTTMMIMIIIKIRDNLTLKSFHLLITFETQLKTERGQEN